MSGAYLDCKLFFMINPTNLFAVTVFILKHVFCGRIAVAGEIGSCCGIYTYPGSYCVWMAPPNDCVFEADGDKDEDGDVDVEAVSKEGSIEKYEMVIIPTNKNMTKPVARTTQPVCVSILI